jgi:altronate hydrolase
MSEAAVAPKSLIVSERDTVAVALTDLARGAVVAVGGRSVELRDPIHRGHKFALIAHAAGEPAIKYGAPIGRALRLIAPGEHVHLHNLETCLSGVSDYLFRGGGNVSAPQAASRGEFMGYRRADGRVGTRNEIWVIATVGCVANACNQIAQRATAKHAGRIDGVHAITHPFGCSQLGDDLSATRKILAALACHPNAGGVLFVGLGCESNQLDTLRAAAPRLEPARMRSVRAQSEVDEIEAGLEAIDELVAHAAKDQRTPCGVGDLVVGLKCGGSDGFSGLTANPLVGAIADCVAASGGTAIVTEIPEMFGAEHMLLERAASREVFDALANTINCFKQHFLDHNQPVYENPSPGNHEGGITTLEEKSLGAVQKAGQTEVTDAIGYGAQWRRAGVTVLEAPGNDAVSGTALAAAGATVVLFTTGRGTPLGFPVPTIKISSNSPLAERKPQWIDFDAGALLAGTARADVEQALLRLVLDVAGGRPARNERNGERAIAIWKRGVTL